MLIFSFGGLKICLTWYEIRIHDQIMGGMGHVLYDDECSVVYSWIWRFPNLKPVLKWATVKKNRHLLMKTVITYCLFGQI